MKSLPNELRFTKTNDVTILSTEVLRYSTEHPEFISEDWAFIVELISRLIGLTKMQHSKFKALCKVTGIKLSAAQKTEILRLTKTSISEMNVVQENL